MKLFKLLVFVLLIALIGNNSQNTYGKTFAGCQFDTPIENENNSDSYYIFLPQRFTEFARVEGQSNLLVNNTVITLGKRITEPGFQKKLSEYLQKLTFDQFHFICLHTELIFKKEDIVFPFHWFT